MSLRKIVLLGLPASILGASDKVFFDRTQSSVPPGWKSVGKASPSDKIQFYLYMPQRNLEVLNTKFESASNPDSKDYQNFLSIQEINEIVSPPAQDVGRLLSWLKDSGIKEGEGNVDKLGDALRVRATVAQAQQLFGASFEWFFHAEGNRTIVSHVGPATIPEHVAPLVELVYGLSDFPVGKKGRVGHVEDQAGGQAVVAQTWQSLYGVPGTFKPAGNSSQNVVQFGGQTFDKEGLDSYGTNVSPVTQPTADHIIGPEQDAGQIEAQLDITSQAAVGQGIEQWFWLNQQQRWMLSFSTDFFNTVSVPYVNSISYDWSELDQCGAATTDYDCNTFGVDSEGLVARTNTEFQKIGLRGVSILTASGDSGVFGRTDSQCIGTKFRPDFPAASPFVTSVGGTYIQNPSFLANGPAICTAGQEYAGKCVESGTEVAVSFQDCHYSSGGGFSNFAPMPSYQTQAVQGYLSSSVPLPAPSFYNASNRAFPDVAAYGYNILLYVNAQSSTLVSGTSAASPTFSGVVSLLNDASLAKTGKPLGFLNPMLYKLAESTPSAFNDVTSGDNKCTEGGCATCKNGFEAFKGWDPVTGLGTPNYKQMLASMTEIWENKAR